MVTPASRIQIPGQDFAKLTRSFGRLRWQFLADASLLGWIMKDVSRVLQEKELDIERVRKDRSAAPRDSVARREPGLGRTWTGLAAWLPAFYPAEDHIGQEAESARPLTATMHRVEHFPVDKRPS